jgi:hypothetical protein
VVPWGALTTASCYVDVAWGILDQLWLGCVAGGTLCHLLPTPKEAVERLGVPAAGAEPVADGADGVDEVVLFTEFGS